MPRLLIFYGTIIGLAHYQNNQLHKASNIHPKRLLIYQKKLPKRISKAFKYDKVLTTEDLIGKQKSEFKEYIKNSMEKSQVVVQESIKGILFSSLDS